MLNPLLIQLFGRDVVDRIEDAGLESDVAVAQLGAEDLSARTGIAPDIAERVMALILESCAAKRPARARRTSAGKHGSQGGPRRSRRPRPSVIPADPAPTSEPAAMLSGQREPDSVEEKTEKLELQEEEQEIDAFVDEAGLIAWMGFAARTGANSPLLSSVADGILDPVAPTAQNRPATTVPEPRHDPAASRPAATQSGSITLEGSLWEFGRRPHGGITISPDGGSGDAQFEGGEAGPEGSKTGAARPVPFHRRRSHDGH